MKARWSRCLCLLALTLFGIPSFAHARGGFFEDALPGLLMVLVALGIIFLLLREFFCWYFKINERVALQKEISGLLKRIVNGTVDIGKQQSEKTDSAKIDDSQLKENQNAFDRGECPSPGCRMKINKKMQKCSECGEDFTDYLLAEKEKQESYDKGDCPECGAKIDKQQLRCAECGEDFSEY